MPAKPDSDESWIPSPSESIHTRSPMLAGLTVGVVVVGAAVVVVGAVVVGAVVVGAAVVVVGLAVVVVGAAVVVVGLAVVVVGAAVVVTGVPTGVHAATRLNPSTETVVRGDTVSFALRLSVRSPCPPALLSLTSLLPLVTSCG